MFINCGTKQITTCLSWHCKNLTITGQDLQYVYVYKARAFPSPVTASCQNFNFSKTSAGWLLLRFVYQALVLSTYSIAFLLTYSIRSSSPKDFSYSRYFLNKNCINKINVITKAKYRKQPSYQLINVSRGYVK